MCHIFVLIAYFIATINSFHPFRETFDFMLNEISDWQSLRIPFILSQKKSFGFFCTIASERKASCSNHFILYVKSRKKTSFHCFEELKLCSTFTTISLESLLLTSFTVWWRPKNIIPNRFIVFCLNFSQQFVLAPKFLLEFFLQCWIWMFFVSEKEVCCKK